MSRQIEVGVHVLMCIAMLWAAASYATYALSNVREGLWAGAAVDTLIWLGAVSLFVWSAREASRKARS